MENNENKSKKIKKIIIIALIVIVAPIAEYHYLVADSYDDYIKITAINIKGKILDQFIIE